MSSKDDGILIPELQIRVTKNWIRLIRYVQVNIPFGSVNIKIDHAQPTKLLDYKQDIRFDKEMEPITLENEPD